MKKYRVVEITEYGDTKYFILQRRVLFFWINIYFSENFNDAVNMLEKWKKHYDKEHFVQKPKTRSMGVVVKHYY